MKARLFGIALVVLATAARADLTGEVVRIIDGDTVEVLVDQRPQRVRLADIDAPESKQAFGSRARQHLGELVFRQQVRVVEKDIDRYSRVVGTIYAQRCVPACREAKINEEMVTAGMAWAYRFHDRPTDPRMAALESEARAAKRGLWSDAAAEEPWKWRRSSKQTAERE